MKKIVERRSLEAQLMDRPISKHFLNFEQFSQEIRNRLEDSNWDPSQEMVRRILVLLHTKSIIVFQLRHYPRPRTR
jgi:hypothetical protein